MRYFLDTEFNEFGGELISLAMVSDVGQSLYAVFGCDNPGQWVAANVMPILEDCPVPANLIIRDKRSAARAIALWLAYDFDPIIVTDWPDDIRHFCELIITGPGEMVGIGGLRFEMHRVDAYPTAIPGAVQHNAWWDAVALRAKLSPDVGATTPDDTREARDGEAAERPDPNQSEPQQKGRP
jgi:hypothetical protein